MICNPVFKEIMPCKSVCAVVLCQIIAGFANFYDAFKAKSVRGKEAKCVWFILGALKCAID